MNMVEGGREGDNIGLTIKTMDNINKAVEDKFEIGYKRKDRYHRCKYDVDKE